MAKKTQKAGAAAAAPAIKNETKPIEKIEDSAAAAKQPVEETEEAAAAAEENEGTAPQEQAHNGTIEMPRLSIVVYCYHGTKEIVEKIWRESVEFNFLVVELEEDEPCDLLSLVAKAMVLDENLEYAVVVAPNTIPTGSIELEDLLIPTVYVDKSGRATFDNKLPFHFEASAAMDLINQVNATDDAIASEVFARRYIFEHRQMPVEVGFSFGNYICPIKSGNPCGDRVIEALIKKKWLTTSPEGFKAIIPELTSRFKLDE